MTDSNSCFTDCSSLKGRNITLEDLRTAARVVGSEEFKQFMQLQFTEKMKEAVRKQNETSDYTPNK